MHCIWFYICRGSCDGTIPIACGWSRTTTKTSEYSYRAFLLDLDENHFFFLTNCFKNYVYCDVNTLRDGLMRMHCTWSCCDSWERKLLNSSRASLFALKTSFLEKTKIFTKHCRTIGHSGLLNAGLIDFYCTSLQKSVFWCINAQIGD